MTMCTLLQPTIDFLQQVVNSAYLLFSFIGISPPPVVTWFNPIMEIFYGCSLT